MAFNLSRGALFDHVGAICQEPGVCWTHCEAMFGDPAKIQNMHLSLELPIITCFRCHYFYTHHYLCINNNYVCINNMVLVNYIIFPGSAYILLHCTIYHDMS